MTVALGKDRSELERSLTQAREADAEELRRAWSVHPRTQNFEGLDCDGASLFLVARPSLFESLSDGCRSDIGGSPT
jgi:hypothetical protein